MSKRSWQRRKVPRWLVRCAPHQAIGGLIPPDVRFGAGCRPEDPISRGLSSPCHGGPRVRIHLPPPASHLRTLSWAFTCADPPPCRAPPAPSCLGRRRRGELREIGKPERLLDLPDLRDGIFVAVLAELLALDLLELFAHLVQLALRERLFPSRENDRVLARGVVLVHEERSSPWRGREARHRRYRSHPCR